MPRMLHRLELARRFAESGHLQATTQNGPRMEGYRDNEARGEDKIDRALPS